MPLIRNLQRSRLDYCLLYCIEVAGLQKEYRQLNPDVFCMNQSCLTLAFVTILWLNLAATSKLSSTIQPSAYVEGATGLSWFLCGDSLYSDQSAPVCLFGLGSWVRTKNSLSCQCVSYPFVILRSLVLSPWNSNCPKSTDRRVLFHTIYMICSFLVVYESFMVRALRHLDAHMAVKEWYETSDWSIDDARQ